MAASLRQMQEAKREKEAKARKERGVAKAAQKAAAAAEPADADGGQVDDNCNSPDGAPSGRVEFPAASARYTEIHRPTVGIVAKVQQSRYAVICRPVMFHVVRDRQSFEKGMSEVGHENGNSAAAFGGLDLDLEYVCTPSNHRSTNIGGRYCEQCGVGNVGDRWVHRKEIMGTSLSKHEVLSRQ
ncbi:hypothetical protein CERSUDRAFT_71519 [Gelatoporia subvermispora B]|uniref:Uncharacterized protein n=1 Tax=Ceriporiopsis subvermispora (strain B) TaxID=914234 RepID=M2RMD2_CERS8|nr:hypothetical protein CERSUDRAFT_71519 [Gelatoporia subvermispora B]